MSAALEIKNLNKHYGDFHAVKDLNLTINQGEIFGLLGPNGAGKSSTIHLISGLCRMEEGSISVFGDSVVEDFVKTRRQVGLMHQEIMVDNFLPIGDMLDLHPGYYGVPLDKEWRNTLVDRLALGPHLGKKMMKLSGGMKRRFMVAKALIHKPKLLILDEPTAGVDVELRVALWEFVREINASGTTVLLTTHYIEEAEELCGRIGIMHHGELIALDETHALVNKINRRVLHLHFKNAIKESTITERLPFELETQQVSESEVALHLQKDTVLGEVLCHLNFDDNEILDIDLQKGDLEDAFLKLTSSGEKRLG